MSQGRAIDRVKYPRTRHLPNSPGATSDDVYIGDLGAFSTGDVLITEKMDGENTTIGRGFVHARSLDSAPHESRTWVRALAGQLHHDIPEGMRICGENLFARHSIGYTDLPSYFLVFNIWQDDVCLDWDSTQEWAELLGLQLVPELYRGPFPGPAQAHALWLAACDTRPSEGFVVRTVGAFTREQFGTHLAKWVRPGHVQTSQHWMSEQVVANTLKS